MSRGSDVVASHVRAIAAQTSADSGHSCTACTTVSSWRSPLARHLAQEGLIPLLLVRALKVPVVHGHTQVMALLLREGPVRERAGDLAKAS